jgi:hypothetical protein
MEAINEAQERELTGWDAWDAVPRDGPAVFVVDAEAFDRGEVIGRWIDPFGEQVDINEQLRQLVGDNPDQGRWAIVDQIGLGPAAAPETPEALTPEALFDQSDGDAR